jgi:hypothetical protein
MFFGRILFTKREWQGPETGVEKILQESFFVDRGGTGSGCQVSGAEKMKSERKYKENPKKMSMLQDEKQGAVIPPKNQSPDFNVKVAYKI